MFNGGLAMTWLKCIHVDYQHGTALVQSNRTGKSFPVTVKKNIQLLIHRGDHLKVIKSHVSREWIAIDYNAIIGGDIQ